MRFGEQRDDCWDCPWLQGASAFYVLRSRDLGASWDWALLPSHLENAVLATDPTSGGLPKP